MGALGASRLVACCWVAGSPVARCLASGWGANGAPVGLRWCAGSASVSPFSGAVLTVEALDDEWRDAAPGWFKAEYCESVHGISACELCDKYVMNKWREGCSWLF